MVTREHRGMKIAGWMTVYLDCIDANNLVMIVNIYKRV